MPDLSVSEIPNFRLEFLVELARRTRDIDAARNTSFAILDALDDTRRLAAFGTVGGLRRVHYLLAITCFCNLCHLSGVSPSKKCLCTHPPRRTASTARSFAASHCNFDCAKGAGLAPSSLHDAAFAIQFGWPVPSAAEGGFGGAGWLELSTGAA